MRHQCFRSAAERHQSSQLIPNAIVDGVTILKGHVVFQLPLITGLFQMSRTAPRRHASFASCFATELFIDVLSNKSSSSETMAFRTKLTLSRFRQFTNRGKLPRRIEFNAGHTWNNQSFRVLWLTAPSTGLWLVYCALLQSFQNRGSQPGVHVPLGIYLPLWSGTFKVSNRKGKYIYTLFISIYKWILFSKNIICLLLNKYIYD